jgi:hypothetical protein
VTYILAQYKEELAELTAATYRKASLGKECSSNCSWFLDRAE